MRRFAVNGNPDVDIACYSAYPLLGRLSHEFPWCLGLGDKDIMAKLSKDFRKEIKFSEVAVEGLFAGLLAGLAMAAWMAVSALIRSETLGDLFSRFNPTQTASPLMGLLLHLAASSVYGILFGLVWYLASTPHHTDLSGRQAVVLGAGYGVLLFLLGWYLLLPASASPLRQLPFWQFGLAHLIYGAIMGWLIRHSIR